MFYSQRKILLIGPSGAGKSTLCNAIFNQRVDHSSLQRPAGVSGRAMGVTSKIENYWCDNSLVVTDTIGFDDQRFRPEFIAEELRRMLKGSIVNYEKVILCMKLGRVSKPARVYLRLLKAIFDDPASNMILYISGCEDGTTVDQFIEINDENEEDRDLKELIDSLKKQTETNKRKRIELENVITGSLQSHQNREIDEREYLDDRKKTLIKIMTAISVDIGFASVKLDTDLWKGIAEWLIWHFKIVFSKFKLMFTSENDLIVKLSSDGAIEVQYIYGDCSICLDDDNRRWIIVTPCLHRFHKNCFSKVLSGQCPMCNANVKSTCKLP